MDALLTPDEVLLRRFGYVRAVGGGAYIVAVIVLFGLYGMTVWPLLFGVPALAIVTTWYFRHFGSVPRTVVALSLLADTLVLGGAVAYVGGAGSGLVMVYAIVIVSGGILLGPAAARGFTLLCLLLGLAQLGIEELGVRPAVLAPPEAGDRLPVLLISLAVLASVGYLTATYASRLHELIAHARAETEQVRTRGRRRRGFLEHAVRDVAASLAELDGLAEVLEERWSEAGADERARLAARLRMGVSQVEGTVAQLADVGAMDDLGEGRLEPVALPRVVGDVLAALGPRLAGRDVQVDVPEIKVVAQPRAVRRIVHNLLENVAEHTPAGTSVRVSAAVSGPRAVLAVTDDGPGIGARQVAHLFTAEGGGRPRVGLPLVAELCRAMQAEVRYEPPPRGGARFLVVFRLAPAGAPAADEGHAAG